MRLLVFLQLGFLRCEELIAHVAEEDVFFRVEFYVVYEVALARELFVAAGAVEELAVVKVVASYKKQRLICKSVNAHFH